MHLLIVLAMILGSVTGASSADPPASLPYASVIRAEYLDELQSFDAAFGRLQDAIDTNQWQDGRAAEEATRALQSFSNADGRHRSLHGRVTVGWVSNDPQHIAILLTTRVFLKGEDQPGSKWFLFENPDYVVRRHDGEWFFSSAQSDLSTAPGAREGSVSQLGLIFSISSKDHRLAEDSRGSAHAIMPSSTLEA